MENKQIKCIKGESCLHCGSKYCRFVDELDQLKAKNKKLKAKIKYMEEYIQTVENARNEFKKESKFLKGENKRLKQTLTEIKEIAEGMNEECFYDDFDCMNCDMQNGCTYFNKKQILQKISGCEI